MKNKIWFAALFVLFSASAANADCDSAVRTITGPKAKAVIAALKLAGLPSIVTGHRATRTKPDDFAVVTYKLQAVQCSETSGGVYDDGLDTYTCGSILAKTKNEANDKILFDAFIFAGIWGEGGMSKTQFRASDILCKITEGPKVWADYSCTFSGVWSDVCTP